MATRTGHDVRRNGRADNCYGCGIHIPAGAGRLWRCMGSSSGHFDCGDDDDGRWHVSCLDAAACQARREAARAKAREQARRVEDRATMLRALDQYMLDSGEAPGVEHNGGQQYSLEGEEVQLAGHRSRIYGGGTWAIIGADWIWLVRGNGADGDYWGANNVRTQGAGAIGRRVPFNADLADKIRALREEG